MRAGRTSAISRHHTCRKHCYKKKAQNTANRTFTSAKKAENKTTCSCFPVLNDKKLTANDDPPEVGTGWDGRKGVVGNNFSRCSSSYGFEF